MSNNLKLKKVIKSFVPEPISSVFRIPVFVNVFRIRMKMSISHIHILNILVDILQYALKHALKDARGIMVNAVVNGHGDTSSNPGGD